MTESVKMVRMMNWLLGRPKVIPQSLNDDRLAFEKEVSKSQWVEGTSEHKGRHHGARLLENSYLDYFQKMNNARQDFGLDMKK